MPTTLDRKSEFEATSSGPLRLMEPAMQRMVSLPSMGSTTESGGFDRVQYAQGSGGQIVIFQVCVGGKEFASWNPASSRGGEMLRLPLPLSRQIHELRRLSGLTWEEIASIFGVTRRAIHLWASGEQMNSGHARRLRDLLGFLCRIDRGEALRNRDLLLSLLPGGRSLLDLLRAGSFEEALAYLAEGSGGGMRATGRPLSRRAKELRRPPAPAELVGASTESVHKEGRLLRKLSGTAPLRKFNR